MRAPAFWAAVVGVGMAASTAMGAELKNLENADPAVQYRIQVMRGVGANAAAIGLTLRDHLPETQNLASHAEAISLGAKEALSAFSAHVPGGAAKPAVWDHWDDFNARLNKLAVSAAEVARIARAQGPDAARASIVNDMLPMCKSCHDTYRNK